MFCMYMIIIIHNDSCLFLCLQLYDALIGVTALMIACKQRYLHVAQILLSIPNVNIDYTDSWGNSALHYTVMQSSAAPDGVTADTSKRCSNIHINTNLNDKKLVA